MFQMSFADDLIVLMYSARLIKNLCSFLWRLF